MITIINHYIVRNALQSYQSDVCKHHHLHIYDIFLQSILKATLFPVV